MSDRCDPQMVISPLFVPATRPAFLDKAVRAGADAVIIDLEDAVAPADKDSARQSLLTIALPPVTRILRINAIGTPWHDDDLAILSRLDIDAVMLPKCQTEEEAASVGAVIDRHIQLIALVENAAGVANAASIAASPDVARLAFGAADFCADIGCADDWDALLYARSSIVLASRLGGVVAPIDGVTLQLEDPQQSERDARRAAELGFSGKMCIHPSQVAPVQAGFQPGPDELLWARRVVEHKDAGATSLHGMMIDPPIVRRAEQLLARARSAAAH